MSCLRKGWYIFWEVLKDFLKNYDSSLVLKGFSQNAFGEKTSSGCFLGDVSKNLNGNQSFGFFAS